MASLAENKALVRRLVDEVVTNRRVDAIDELATGEIAKAARQWSLARLEQLGLET